LNINGEIDIDPFTKPEAFYDVNADGRVTAADAQAVINYLNGLSSNGGITSQAAVNAIRNMPSELQKAVPVIAKLLQNENQAAVTIQRGPNGRSSLLPGQVVTQAAGNNPNNSGCVPCVFFLDIGQTLGDPYNGSGGSFTLRLISDVGTLDLPPIEVINSRLNRVNTFLGGPPNSEYDAQSAIIAQAIIAGFNGDPNWPNLGINDVIVSNTGPSGQFYVTICRVPTNGIQEVTTPGGRVTNFHPISGAITQDGWIADRLITAHTEVIGLPSGTQSTKWVDMRGIPPMPSNNFPGILYRWLSGRMVFLFRTRADIDLGIYDNYIESQEIDPLNTSMAQLQTILNSTMSIPVLGVSNGFQVGSDTTPNLTDPMNGNVFYIGVRSSVTVPVPSSEDLFEFRTIGAIAEFPSYMNLALVEQGECPTGLSDNPCELSNILLTYNYDLLPRRPINIYATYVKYIMRDYINPDIKGTVIVPVEQWSGLNRTFAQTPCSFWISNTIPTIYERYNDANAGDIVGVSGLDKFISPVMGIGGTPQPISSPVPLPDQDGVAGRIIFGDARCTRTKNQIGYTACVIESIEVLTLAATANNLQANPPFIERVFDEEVIFFDPGLCDNLDIVFVIDNSGSMGNTINNVKDSINDIILFVRSIGPNSTIGLVSYGQINQNGDPIVLLPSTPVDTPTNQQLIRDAVDTMAPTGGREPHFLAITEATNVLIQQPSVGRTRLIILSTDEDAIGVNGNQGQADNAATNAAANDITIFSVQVNRAPLFDFMISIAQITSGAAVLQLDGLFVDPLIKLLTRFCLSSDSTSGVEVLTPNQCTDDPNPATLNVTLQFDAPNFPTQQYTYPITDIELLQTIGNEAFWPYNPPSNLQYDTRPDGNWLNYPPVPLQGVEMMLARWEGFKLFTDLPDGTGAVQCTGINVRIVRGGGLIKLPITQFDGTKGNTIARCFTDIDVQITNPGGNGAPAIQNIILNNATGGSWNIQFGDTTSGDVTTDLFWDSTGAEVQTALENLTNLSPGLVTVMGNAPNYSIQFSQSLGVVPAVTAINNLTCTDQIINLVPPVPYDYEVLKPGPNTGVDPIDESCFSCAPIVTNTLKFHLEGISAGCDTRARSIACRFTKQPSNYAYYKYDGTRLVEISNSYEAVPGDRIVLINKVVNQASKLLPRIARSFAAKL